MSWKDHHSRSESLAARAEAEARSGNRTRAAELYLAAAHEESAAFTDLPQDKIRTRGITAVSAVALLYKGHDFSGAESLAHDYLRLKDRLPPFALTELRNLLNVIWTRSDASAVGVQFLPGDVLVSIKGGEVIFGGAPLDLIMRKVEGIQSVLFRTVEMLLDIPFRKHGTPPSDVQAMFRPWLFQAPPGSYQFAVRMQEPAQKDFWEAARPKAEQVTETFFQLLRASVTNPDAELPKLVTSEDYRLGFLTLSRNLAPTGKTFDRLEISNASAPSEPIISLGSETRKEINAEINRVKPRRRPGDPSDPFPIKGTLRAVHLDEDWLELSRTHEEPRHLRIMQAGEALDDVIGPMVNKHVTVTVVRRGSDYLYRDIEPEE